MESAHLMILALLVLCCCSSLGFRFSRPIRITSLRSSLLGASIRSESDDFTLDIESYYASIKDEVKRVDKQISDIEKSLSTSSSSAFNVILQNKLTSLRLVVQRKRFEIEKMDKGGIDLQEIATALESRNVPGKPNLDKVVAPVKTIEMETAVSAPNHDPDPEVAAAAPSPTRIHQAIRPAAEPSAALSEATPEASLGSGLGFEAGSDAREVNERPSPDSTADGPIVTAIHRAHISADARLAEPPRIAVEASIAESAASLNAQSTHVDHTDPPPPETSKVLIRGTYDYGFSSKSYSSGRPSLVTDSYEVPPSALALSLQTFSRELLAIFKIDKLVDFALKPLNSENAEALSKLRQLTLSTEAVLAREEERGVADAPFIIKRPYEIITGIIDWLFADKNPIARFYFLETVARVPYYSYISMIHTYETLGWWRRSTAMKRIHFAQEYNELHHLMIWEALGGDQDWIVRFCAQHSAVFSFYFLVVMWCLSPKWAYNFSELLEGHAVDTYAEFAEANRELLESMAPPQVAKEYYENKDLYIFDEFNNNKTRRPVVNTLYDVVCAIRDDEIEHITTAWKCQGYDVIVEEEND